MPQTDENSDESKLGRYEYDRVYQKAWQRYVIMFDLDEVGRPILGRSLHLSEARQRKMTPARLGPILPALGIRLEWNSAGGLFHFVLQVGSIRREGDYRSILQHLWEQAESYLSLTAS